MFRKIIALIAVAVLLTGCAVSDQTEGSTATMNTADNTTVTPQPEPQPVDPVIEKGILNKGNGYRLQQKIRAAQNGEDITIAYIGGSITEGPDVSYAERYVTITANEFADTYCNGGEVTCINAGLSGTPSNLGVLRLQRDVLDHEPDIVFVEFAVNDSQDMQEKLCFESLVRTVLEQENEPAVVLIFNRTKDGYTCQSTMGLTGLYYSLPMVSVNNAVSSLLDEGTIAWSDFSKDEVHPNAYGHRLTSDIIAYLFALAERGEWDEYAVPTTMQYQAPYRNAFMITPENEDMGDICVTDWGSFAVHRGNRSGFLYQWRATQTEPLRFTVTGNSVFLVYRRNKTENMGAADIYINGEKTMTIDSCDPDGWDDPWSKLLVKSKTVETYEIEIRLTDDSVGKFFDIYALAYTQNA